MWIYRVPPKGKPVKVDEALVQYDTDSASVSTLQAVVRRLKRDSDEVGTQYLGISKQTGQVAGIARVVTDVIVEC